MPIWCNTTSIYNCIVDIKIKITYGDGSLPDFRNIDHSFTLKIIELVNYPKNTGINSKKTNFISTLKTIKK